MILQQLSNYNVTHKVIASDMNFGNCYYKFPVLESKPLDAAASDLFSSYGFSQLIDIPTRVTENTTRPGSKAFSLERLRKDCGLVKPLYLFYLYLI